MIGLDKLAWKTLVFVARCIGYVAVFFGSGVCLVRGHDPIAGVCRRCSAELK